MIAGAPLSWWIGFHIAVLGLLLIDLLLMGRSAEGPRLRAVAAWTLLLLLLAIGFAGWLLHAQGSQRALEFLSGYVIEASLSVDNLFVFLLLFSSFGLTTGQQRMALNWGLLGAIVLRAGFIFAGVALLTRFHAVQYIFGALLLYAASRLLRPKPRAHDSPKVAQWIERRGWSASPLLIAIVTVEVTDLIFAVDSIPAVLAVTHDPFVVYTSNILAILGLRSLYFVLRGMLNRLRLLHFALGIILAFVGLKMLTAHWFEIPTLWSLGVILATLAVFTAASLLRKTPVHAGDVRLS
jgi:tellurite resistance protein TerC